MTVTKATRQQRESDLRALKQALVLERKAQFVDFKGHHSTFSQFMTKEAEKLCARYPYESCWPTIRGLFRQYSSQDPATRISIVHRAEDLLDAAISERQESNKSDHQQQTHSEYVPKSTPEKSERQKDTVLSAVPSLKPKIADSKAHITKTEPHAPPGETDVQYVKGVGPKMAALLNNMEIYTAEDLLRHYPRRHLDFQNRLMIKDLQPGQDVTIFGTIRSVGAFQSKKGNVSILSVVISDGTGNVTITRFIGGRSNKYLLERYKQQFPKSAQVIASGTVEVDRFKRKLQLKNAEIEILGTAAEGQDEFDSIHTGRLVPVYRLSEGISLRQLRNIIHNALEGYGHMLTDPLPEHIKKEYMLVDLQSAVREIHFPSDPSSNDEARRRLVFDELFLMQLQLAYRRYHSDLNETGLALNQNAGDLVQRFRALLPFKLTGAQERVFQDIARDLASTKPMHRLVQGDVGSGKTVVAIMSLLVAIQNGYQGVLMAPTEILAEQHYRQLQNYLPSLGIKVALCLGKQGAAERRVVQRELLNGQVHIAVGTHALIQESIEFRKLGLIIIDEQHRFGVKQRAKLKAKGYNPELLTMTATPIPRTLALSVHGDLDVSEIDELPPGRKPIKTKAFMPADKRQIWAFVHSEVKKGRQAYIIFPLIEESETLSAKAATAEYEKLRVNTFADMRMGLMHGKLKPQEKEEVMEKFRGGEIDILVSTTVIEVGVDVPNASVMVIENADRFGLAQLHQLRGRIGRGTEQSYCLLIADLKSETVRQRLEILTQTNDGFVVAQKDLELRGPGEFLGVRQSGLPDLGLADIVQDAKVLEDARHAAIDLIKRDPELASCSELQIQVTSRIKSQEADILASG